jgi:hypothetical protein
VLQLILLFLRALALTCHGHHEVALENIALRQQLRALQRTVGRPRLQCSDRVFWILLANTWRRWRTALVLVQPATVLRWHRDLVRRRWTRRSCRTRDGRPSVDHTIRALVSEMATANPLWGAPCIQGELRKLGLDVSERSYRGCWPVGVVRRHKHGGRSWPITSRRWCRWISSPSPR